MKYSYLIVFHLTTLTDCFIYWFNLHVYFINRSRQILTRCTDDDWSNVKKNTNILHNLLEVLISPYTCCKYCLYFILPLHLWVVFKSFAFTVIVNCHFVYRQNIVHTFFILHFFKARHRYVVSGIGSDGVSNVLVCN